MFKLKKSELIFLFIVSLIIFVPLFFLRDYTPKNELKYINIANDMYHNGRLFTLIDNGNIYTDKPPFFFWFMNIIRWFSGSYGLGYIGLFLTAVPAILTVAVAIYLNGKYNKENHMLMPLILVTTPLFLISGICIRMDMFMGLWIVLSLIVFFQIYDGKMCLNRVNSYMIYIFMGMGLFIKGGAALIVPLLTILVFLVIEKELKFLKKIYFLEGIGIIIFMFLLWLIPAVIANGKEFLSDIFIKQTVGRTIKAIAHDRPFYYYIILLPGLYFQWFILLFAALGHYIKNYRNLDNYEKFMLIWFVVTIVFFSIIKSKLWLYILPSVFPAAALISLYIVKIFKENRKKFKIILSFSMLMFFISALLLLFLSGKAVKGYLVGNVWIGALLIIISLIFSGILLINNKKSVIIFSLVIPIVIFMLNLAFLVKDYNGLIGIKDISNEILKLNPSKIISYDFSSGVYAKYYINKEVEYLDNEKMLKDLVNKENNIVLIMETKDLKKIPLDIKYTIFYNNSVYSGIKIIK